MLVTGHTGFKGGWLVLLLNRLGAEVHGFSLAPPTSPSFYALLDVHNHLTRECIGDIRDRKTFQQYCLGKKFDAVFHLAAEAIVLTSYDNPYETHETNVLGSLNVLEETRIGGLHTDVLIVVTSDKVYLNQELNEPFGEESKLGGADPYSGSKAAAEVITLSYIKSFFNHTDQAMCATVRAGNVIGGGDFAPNRLVPDLFRSIQADEPLPIRNPSAVRPWQFVLEPLSGYLTLAEKMFVERKRGLQGGWNFGPSPESHVPVSQLVDSFFARWRNSQAVQMIGEANSRQEAKYLSLDISKALSSLNWSPLLDINSTIDWTVEWYKTFSNSPSALSEVTSKQLEEFISAGTNSHG